jgi:tetratricopeptide (TPR) repeat protein
MVLAAIAAVLAAGTVGVVWVLTLPERPRRQAEPENPQQRREEVRQAFRELKPLAPDEIDRELKTLFNDLGDALRAADQHRIAEFFDTDRLVDEMAAQELFPRAVFRARRAMARGMRARLGQGMAQNGGLMRWTTSDIKAVKKLADDEVVVIVRHHAEGGIELKMRWWLTRRSGTYKVYDMEDIDTALRASTMVVDLVAEGRANIENLPALQQSMTCLNEVVMAMSREDVDTMERKLKEIAAVKLPAKIDAVRLLMTGVVHLQREKYQEALDTLDRAAARHADMPALDFLRAIALNGLGKSEQALKHIEAYRDLLGEDEHVCVQRGLALHGLQRLPEACASYRKTLDFNPKNGDAFLWLLQCLGKDDRRDDVPGRFARLDQHHETFDACAEDRCQNRDGVGLEQIALAMRRIDPKYAPVDYYLALTKVWVGQSDQAVPLFRAALTKEANAEKRQEYFRGFSQAMVQAGQPLAAYTAAPDPRDAFRMLAADLAERNQTDPLKALIAAHRQKHPADPLLPFYQAEVYTQEGKYALADKTFTAALARPPDRATLEKFRPSRVLARYHTGQGLAAYREIGPRPDTFEQLASLWLEDGNEAQLQALLDAHERVDPGNPRVLLYRGRLKIRQEKVAEGIALFKSAISKKMPAEQQQTMVHEFLGDMFEAGQPLAAYQAVPDAREAFTFLAARLGGQANLEELRRLVQAHRARQPDDPWLAYYTADLHLKDRVWAEAVRVLREAWKKAPADARRSFRGKYVYALHKAGRALEAYREVEPREETFNQLANLLLGERNGARLEALIEAHRPHAAEDPALLCYAARAKVLLHQEAEAAALLDKAYRKQANQYLRRSYVDQFVRDMAAAGKGLEAYRSAPDPAAAFETLAQDWLVKKNKQELERLLEAHRPRHAQEPLFLYYLGEAQMLAGNLAQAETQFTAALKASPQDPVRYRHALFRARIRAGKVAATYQEFRADPQTFETLAGVCIQEENVGQLEALVAAHRKAQPEDPRLAGWGLEVKWLKKDYAGVLRLLAEDQGGVFTQPRFRWKRDDYRVRCLVKLGKTREAVQEAEALMRKRRMEGPLLVLAHAVHGGAPGAITAMAKVRGGRFASAEYYGDEDLGPLLRSEPFRAFREKFPEPKVEDEKDEEEEP